MACPDWPPPLPSLPLYPPCIKKPKKTEVVPKNSSHQEWWDEYLGLSFKRASGREKRTKNHLYELTSGQRRELLPVRIPTKQDRLIQTIPLPAGSYPPNGLPIWERLYLDCPLPMLRAPPDALVFARQQIGQKLWKTGEEQEFILYDPQGYEVQFSYENVHDPHLTNYYHGKEIRGFLLSMGQANADGWSICTLRRFNQYRKYLRRVHLSLVHREMEYQDTLQDEQIRIKMYKQITNDTMEQNERKALIEEAGAANREALRQYRINRIKRLLKNVREKERRVRKLYRRRAREQEQMIKKGQRLQAEQEVKKKISNELNRRKKIATLRRWHESDERRMKFMRKKAEEKARQKAEKVRLRWHSKIDNQRKMFAIQDEHLELHATVRRENIKLRNNYAQNIKQKQLEQFQELRKGALRKKALAKRRKEEYRMSEAIMEAWLRLLNTDYDLETEEYRVKKSLNSTMAELLSQDTEGPNRFSIITMARNRIQREQSIPLQVSFAIEIILETTIEIWATKRIRCLLETVVRALIEDGGRRMEERKIKSKDIGQDMPNRNYKASDPRGIIYKEDEIPKKEQRTSKTTDSSRTTLAETEIERNYTNKETKSEEGDQQQENADIPQITKGVIISYVHFGPTDIFEYPAEEEIPFKLKPVRERPKSPMPSQKTLCEAGFSEQRLRDVLPTLPDVATLKEKAKFRKVFKKTAVQLFKRAVPIAESAYNPVSRIRAINKLIYLGDSDRSTLSRTLCFLVMNKPEKSMWDCKEFEWISQALAREAINEVLKPPEFQRLPNDGVARTKIMFCKPKQRKKRP